MSRRKSIPDPVIVSLQPDSLQKDCDLSLASSSSPVQAELIAIPIALPIALPIATTENRELPEARLLQVEAFLQDTNSRRASSLSFRTQKAYRQDLQQFLNWTDKSWAEITPRQIAQFKKHLLRQDFQSGQRALSDATVRRILGTLRSFYGWMVRSGYVHQDPTAAIELPKPEEPETKSLEDKEIAQIYRAAAASSLPERNLALVTLLLHGLRAEEISAFDIADYDGQRLHIRSVRADKGAKEITNRPISRETESESSRSTWLPLTAQGRHDLEQYLRWRQERGEALSDESPLLVSHSRRNGGGRLGYDAIRKLLKQITQQTGIDLSTYLFRHTFATNLLRKGMNPHHAMMLTRHRSPQNFQRYLRAADRSQDQLAAEAAFLQIMDKPTEESHS